MKYLVFLLLFFPGIVSGHIGSPGVVFEGNAGPYAVQVFVQPPDVIPGTAKVTVLVGAPGVHTLSLKPVYFFAGDEGSPKADPALPVPGEAGRYEGTIWFMEDGSASVSVSIDGPQGKGSVVVPVAAVSTATRTMPYVTGWVLAGLGVLLIGLMTTLFGASISDSLLKPGERDTPGTRRKRIAGSAVGATLCIGLVAIGHNWWGSWANEYRRHLYKPYQATTQAAIRDDVPYLQLTIDSASAKGRSLSYLVPDHGKLMHLFLLRQGSMDAFAHLHPTRRDSLHFEAALPKLPPGRYLVYADMLRLQGLAYTVTDTLDIPPLPSGKASAGDPEDTYAVTSAINRNQTLVKDQAITVCGKPGVKIALQDGSSIVWEATGPLQAGKPYSLNFTVTAPDGKPAVLQPYLGMTGHAAVFKDDGSVYIHLHPTGTFSTASQQIMESRIAEKSTFPAKLPSPDVFRDSIDRVMARLHTLPEAQRDSLLMPGIAHSHKNHLAIPYAFPTPGSYRLWLQVKRNGKVLTGVFDAKVL